NFHFGVGEFAGNVNSDLPRFDHVVPTRSGAADAEVLGFHAGGNRRWRDGQVGQCHAGQGALDEFAHEGGRADLDELGGAGHQFRLAHVGVNGKYPSGAAHAPLVGDDAFPVVIAGRFERNAEAVGGNDGLEMQTDVALEFLETFAEAEVIVKR